MYTPDFAKPKVLSVSQLNFYIKSVLESDPKLNYVFLSGEISNLTIHQKSGHIYFSLKDSKSIVKAVMFSGNARNLVFEPKEGMKILCRGRLSVYEPSGQYQIYVEDMQAEGIGALTLAFEQLKNNLEQKGLFAQEHKKPIPRFPETIGVITSPAGAAVQDIRNILFRRYPCVDVVMCPVLVQGSNAPEQLVRAIKMLDEHNACDVIIIGRGGGSIEDLWAFNNEELAYAVYDCKIPVISAVGHETDFTICDFVADLRAPTPSAAAELAVPDKEELLAYYNAQTQYLSSIITSKLNKNDAYLNDVKRRLVMLSPENKILQYERELDNYMSFSEKFIFEILGEKNNTLSNIASKLESLNPVSVLSRGYAVAEVDDKVIKSKSQLKKDDEFSLVFSDGKIIAKVIGE